jgi:two-component system OmpR family response regulator
MLPGENGLSICRRLRAGGGPPVVMLTARDEDGDRIAGLDGGADDYVSKPFNPQVLLARIRAVLRRGAPIEGERLILADLAIDPAARSVLVGDAELSLTAAEFDLLLSFAQAFDRSIDMQVSRLRRRLEEAGSEVAGLIRTVRNAGYILAAAVRRG